MASRIKSSFFFPEKPELVERRVLETVYSVDYQNYVLYSSFNHRMVGTIKRLDPGSKTGVLYNAYRDYGRLPSKLAGRVGAEVFVCAKHELTPRLLDDARQTALAVYVYTLNSTAVVGKMLEMGVDGILSDVADDIVKSVRKSAP